jgi:hypothetical protein
MTTFVKRQDDAIGLFQGAWGDHGEARLPAGDSWRAAGHGPRREERTPLNEGPSVPGAAIPVSTRSGYTVPTGGVGPVPCSGCRQGDTFYPTLQLTGSGGAPQGLIGFDHNDGLVETLFAATGCGATAPPTLPALGSTCDFTLRDQSGHEIERRTKHVLSVDGVLQ